VVDQSRSSSNCSSRRSTPSTAAASGSTPPSSGVLKNVHVFRHMRGSQLTVKFQHVKRHENGLSSSTVGDRHGAEARLSSRSGGAGDVASSRSVHGLPGSTMSDGGSVVKNHQSSPPSMNGLRRSPVAMCNGLSQPLNSPQCRAFDNVQQSSWSSGIGQNQVIGVVSAAQQNIERLGVFESTLASSTSGEARHPPLSPVPSPHQLQPLAATKPFSPQFEDISDAEDETPRPPTGAVSAAPIVPLDAASAAASLCRVAPLPPHMTPLSVGMYQVPNDNFPGTFFTAAATAGGSLTAALPLGSWNGFVQPPSMNSGQLSQMVPTSTIMPPSVVGRPPYFVASTWLDCAPVICRPQGPYSGASGGGFERVAPLNVSPIMNPTTSNAVGYSNADNFANVSMKQEISPTSASSLLPPRKTEADVGDLCSDTKMEYGNVGIKNELVIKSEVSMADEDFGFDSSVDKLTVAKHSMNACNKSESDLTSTDDDQQYKSGSTIQIKEKSSLCNEQRVINAVDGTVSALKTEKTECDDTGTTESPNFCSSPNPAVVCRPELSTDTTDSGSRPSTPAAASSAAVPKVPPLRIIIPSKANGATTAVESISSNTVVTSKASVTGSLPYVVSIPQDAGAEESLGSDHNDNDQVSESESIAGQGLGLSESESAMKDAAGGSQFDSIMTRRRKIKQPKVKL